MSTLEKTIEQLSMVTSEVLQEKVREFIKTSRLISNALDGFTMNGMLNPSHERENVAFFAGIAELCHLVELIFQRPDFQETRRRLWILDRIAAEFDHCPAKWFIVAKLNELVAARAGNPDNTRIELHYRSGEFTEPFRRQMEAIFSAKHSRASQE